MVTGATERSLVSFCRLGAFTGDMQFKTIRTGSRVQNYLQNAATPESFHIWNSDLSDYQATNL